MSSERRTSGMSAMISAVLTHVQTLLRKEVALLKAEMSARVNRVIVALGFLAFAMVLGVTGLNALAGAATAGLVAAGIAPGWAAAIIFGSCLIIAVLVGWKGINMLKDATLVPHETIKAVKKDAAVLKETYND